MFASDDDLESERLCHWGALLGFTSSIRSGQTFGEPQRLRQAQRHQEELDTVLVERWQHPRAICSII